MSGQPQRPLNNPAELLQQMMQQFQMELNLANQHGKDTPEGANHLFRARQLKLQLVNIQQQIQRRQSQQQEQQQQMSQQQSQLSQHSSPQTPHQQLPGGNADLNAQQQQQTQQQQQQRRMAQMAQMAQMNQMSHSQQSSPQPGHQQLTPQMHAQQLQQQQQQQQQQPQQQQQQPQGQGARPAVNVNAANGFQQRFAQVEELRRHYTTLTTRIEQTESVLSQQTLPAEVEKLQRQIQFMQTRRDQVRQRELQLMRELRQAIERRNQAQAQAQGQQQPGQQPGQQQQQPGQQAQQAQQRPPSAKPQDLPRAPATQVPAGQQPAAQLQNQMLRGIPRNQQGQPIPANQVNATRAAQFRAFQQAQQAQQNTSQNTNQNQTQPSQPGATPQGANAAAGMPAPPGVRPGAGAAGAAGAGAGAATAGATGGPTFANNQSNLPSGGMNAGAMPMAPGAAANLAAAGSASPVNAPGTLSRPELNKGINPVVSNASRAMAQSLPIPAQLNIPPPQPVNSRAGRPTLTNGGATDAQALNSPALIRAPPLDLSGDRLLSKRKLSDLVSSVMGEDNEPLIDGDVEELLLDLADEFVSSVTSFACKLAKHRKSDVLEAKDIHMHLERNWNMHIAGYSSDEIRSIRRFMPTQSYQQKLQGIGMAKSINK